ncbi:MarR family winged helix-turn-helix transcriptional regulator [Pseudobacteroides cellulosolvens]|uniref:Transcriptional regulator, MarR family n=1 Tax=Pseudobacteroides cellulosolvens ATCC 35603 = DSM 2933 TaxID=398512 RepID=A0A0L6JTZ8_9FIRM|nr:transcriptional regulator [Pseudobacteroides cellulosolvens]KNY29321.1 transcriptional regulator, MarR family [Pseudobacteroides cellulosolvens ATCC 35603 = DSM 2933]
MDALDKQKFIFGSLFLLANKLQVIGDQHLESEDMTIKQWFLTVIISQFGSNSPTLSEVAQLMGSSRQNVKQLALKLQEKDFLSIEKDDQDARATRLKLTQKSQDFWENREDKDHKFLGELFHDFDMEELTLMYKGFNKLLNQIEKMEKSGVRIQEVEK